MPLTRKLWQVRYEMLRRLADGPMSTNDVIELCNLPQASANQFLKEMCREGFLDRTGTGKPRQPYVYTLRAPCDWIKKVL
jgi:predicted transcriptional regulator